MLLKVIGVLVVLLQVVPIMVWVERRGSALMQNRLGPNRVGPLGLIQSLADALKFIFKEDPIPGHVNKFYYVIAPLVALVPAFMTFAVIPFASSIEINGTVVNFQLAELNVGLLYILSIGSLGVYGIIMAGWASNSKYALFGSLRSTSQMISYELSMGLSIIGIVMAFSTLELGPIVVGQTGSLVESAARIWPGLAQVPFLEHIPRWGVFIQPLGFLIFLTAVFAETNRLPFDLPEGESEIVAGFHLEYGAMKFALFFMAEYTNMFVAAALVTTLFFGGWHAPGLPHLLDLAGLQGMAREWVRILLEIATFMLKTGFFLWFFVWVRWTVPRFRYDQLMNFGWKVMLPLSLVNIFITGVLIFYGVI
ncbi:MAG: NADH-quinone oxidoreductase subunit NuoH [Bdellovibrionales bacterium]|nr:NADH-quinone oxidoreductase subunit NuoH [Bdellovibrionales bacterium]